MIHSQSTEDNGISRIMNQHVDGVAGRSEQTQDQNLDHEYSIPSVIKFTSLGGYFFSSLLLTLHNKLVLGTFQFPWLLTFLHASFASIGAFIMMHLGYFKLSQLGRRQNLALVASSVLFTANIAISNLSLILVSIPFYQTMRMLCPIFTVIIYHSWYGRIYSYMTYLSIVPLVIGACMTTAGGMTFSSAGFLLTILGVVLAAVKTVVTNRFMTGPMALPPIELLLRLSLLTAMHALACATAVGELAGFRELVASEQISVPAWFISLMGNGFLAFLLNISSFGTNKVAGALTMTVCGNLKQCLTIVAGIFLFNVTVDLLNGTGMVVTMAGAAMYSKAEFNSKKGKHYMH